MEPITTATVLAGYYTFKEFANIVGEIKSASPKIADNAKSLWNKVSRKGANASAKPTESGGGIASGLTEDSAVDGVAVADLQNQVRASLEVTNALAEQSERFADFVEATRQHFEATEKQNRKLIERLDTDELAIKTLEKQNDLLAKRVESDSALIKGLESYNLRLAKEVEVERVRVNRLNSICIAIGVVAVAGLAIAVRLSLQ